MKKALAVPDKGFVMKVEYFGDSYDIVKRFWAESLHCIAPLYTHTRFIPKILRLGLSHLTKMQVFDPNNQPEGAFGLFLDPDTGIAFFKNMHGKDTRKHITLNFIIQANKNYNPSYIICFDQSFHRTSAIAKSKQMEEKMKFLESKKLHSFYYDSHATFIFISEKQEVLIHIYEQLTKLGIPEERLWPKP